MTARVEWLPVGHVTHGPPPYAPAEADLIALPLYQAILLEGTFVLSH